MVHMPDSRPIKYHAIILAAGFSKRMGTPKWKLTMPSGETFLQYIINEYSIAGVISVVVVNDEQQGVFENRKLPKNLKVVVNSHPEKGRMYSLQCGLEKVQPSGPCFLHNIDNPFVSTPLIHKMTGALKEHDYLVPVCNEIGGHPLLINEKLAESMVNCSEPLPVLRDFLKNYHGYRMDYPDERILLNINTPEQYRAFLSIQG